MSRFQLWWPARQRSSPSALTGTGTGTGTGIVYGVVGYHGLAKVDLYQSTAGTSARAHRL
jgi:hypothetical protein